MRIFGLNGTVQKMDAEQMQFPDNSFDFNLELGESFIIRRTRPEFFER